MIESLTWKQIACFSLFLEWFGLEVLWLREDWLHKAFSSWRRSWSVWPVWALFEIFWPQIFPQKLPKNLATFWDILKIITNKVKTANATFGPLSVAFGPLFTLTSGHTDLDQTERGEGGFGSTRSDQDGAHCLRVIMAKSKCFKT